MRVRIRLSVVPGAAPPGLSGTVPRAVATQYLPWANSPEPVRWLR
ncbi:hypothetical protein EDF50_2903 [Frigoribacterium sp. PhB24]|nr:hypothetical protein EDF50_2903 [Frigoribacterium sp. PhB24]